MSDKSLSIPVQYVLRSSIETLARPYEIKSGVKNTFDLWLDVSPLPQENHWKVVVEAQVMGRAHEDTPCMISSCAIEAIVVVGGLTPQEVDEVLRQVAAPSVLGSVRSLLSSLTQGSGFGTVILPPLSIEQIASLPSRDAMLAAED
jgi:preprotein translocase subunit SecB